jgi:ABC-type phosphate transport system auxiliary subunit
MNSDMTERLQSLADRAKSLLDELEQVLSEFPRDLDGKIISPLSKMYAEGVPHGWSVGGKMSAWFDKGEGPTPRCRWIPFSELKQHPW